MAPGAQFTVTLRTAQASGAIGLFGPHDLQVGSSIDDAIAADPGGVRDEPFEGSARIALEISGGSGYDVTGVLGVATDGSLTVIESPVYVFGDC